MLSERANFYRFSHKFSEFEEFAEGIRAWDLDFRQLDPGASPAELVQIGYAGIQLMHVRLNRRYDQRGSVPPGTRTFALLDQGINGVVWCGRQVTDRALLIFDAGGDFEAVSQPGFKVFTFSLPLNMLLETVRRLGVQGIDERTTGNDNAIELTSSAARALRRHMTQLELAAATNPTLLDKPLFINEFACELPNRLMETIALSIGTPKRLALRTRHLALKKAVEYLNASPNSILNVSDLCRITDVSERTLEYAFKEHYGISPKRYLLCTRLNAVHKTQVTAVPGEVTVANVAHRFGFWHMNQFAADHKRLFGMLPQKP